MTLEEKLDQLLAQGKLSELEELFFYYLKKVQNLHSTDTFIKTPEFVQVFGDVELTGEYSCAKCPILTWFLPIF